MILTSFKVWQRRYFGAPLKHLRPISIIIRDTIFVRAYEELAFKLCPNVFDSDRPRTSLQLTNIGFYILLNKSRFLVILKALPFQLGHSKNKKNERLLSHRVQYTFVCADYYTIFKMLSVLGHYHSLSLVWLRLMYLFQGWTLDVSLLLIINLLNWCPQNGILSLRCLKYDCRKSLSQQ